MTRPNIFGRFDEFGWGMAAASLLAGSNYWRPPAWIFFFSLSSLPIILASWNNAVCNSSGSWILPFYPVFLDFCFFLIITHQFREFYSKEEAVSEFVLKGVAFLGVICFSLYVWHGFLTVLLKPHQASLLGVIIYFITLFVFSVVSFFFIERGALYNLIKSYFRIFYGLIFLK